MPYPYHEDLIRGTMKRIPEMAKLNRRFRKLTWAFSESECPKEFRRLGIHFDGFESC